MLKSNITTTKEGCKTTALQKIKCTKTLQSMTGPYVPDTAHFRLVMAQAFASSCTAGTTARYLNIIVADDKWYNGNKEPRRGKGDDE